MASAEDPINNEVAKLLTHVEASVREKTVQKICKYLKLREKAQTRVDDGEFQKLWKALYYCFWMTDKVPIQMEMGNMLAELSRSLSRDENVHAFFSAFFHVLRREWGTIDYLRLNKFLALVRRMVNEWFIYLRTHNWNEKVVEHFVETFRDQVLLPIQPDGLRMHVAFVYLPELAKVAGPKIEEKTLRELLSPFLCVLLAPPSEVMLNATIKDVFQVLENNLYEDVNGNVVKFENFDKKNVGSAIFDMAATDESLTSGKRKTLYTLAKRFNVASRSAASIAASAAGSQKENDEGEKAQVVNNTSKMEIEDDDEEQKEEEEKPVKQQSTKKAKKQQAEVQAAKKARLLFQVEKDDEEPIAGTKSAKKGAKPVTKKDEEEEEEAEEENDMDKSFESTGTSASKKNVRFSHKDIMKIPAITRKMKETQKKSSAEFGMPKKGLLKKSSSSDIIVAADASKKNKKKQNK